LARTSDFCLIQTDAGGPTQPQFNDCQRLFLPGVKRPGHEADHSHYSVPWISGDLTPPPHILSRCTKGLNTLQTAWKCPNNIRSLTVDTEAIFNILSGSLTL